MKETTTIRNNLMNDQNYSPYCGDFCCNHNLPRSKYDSVLEQFKCKCGWVSEFPKEFIKRYKKKWNK